jgi:hypothetical protein
LREANLIPYAIYRLVFQQQVGKEIPSGQTFPFLVKENPRLVQNLLKRISGGPWAAGPTVLEKGRNFKIRGGIMAKKLWAPSQERVKNSHMYRFMDFVNRKHKKDFSEYPSLHEWSVENIPDFWAAMWDFAEIKASRPYDEVVDNPYKMPGTRWFSGPDSILRRTFSGFGTITWP